MLFQPETLADAKKTDAVSPDDEPKEEKADKEEEVGPGGDNKPSPKKSKSSLETAEVRGVQPCVILIFLCLVKFPESSYET